MLTPPTLLLSWERLPDSVLFQIKAETLNPPPCPQASQTDFAGRVIKLEEPIKGKACTALNHKASSIAFVLRRQQNGWAALGDLADGKLIRDASFRERDPCMSGVWGYSLLPGNQRPNRKQEAPGEERQKYLSFISRGEGCLPRPAGRPEPYFSSDHQHCFPGHPLPPSLALYLLGFW